MELLLSAMRKKYCEMFCEVVRCRVKWYYICTYFKSGGGPTLFMLTELAVSYKPPLETGSE